MPASKTTLGEGAYRQQFGGTFDQSMLATLAKQGFLVPDVTSRGGNRRYYRLSDPQAIRDLVAELDRACCSRSSCDIRSTPFYRVAVASPYGVVEKAGAAWMPP